MALDQRLISADIFRVDVSSHEVHGVGNVCRKRSFLPPSLGSSVVSGYGYIHLVSAICPSSISFLILRIQAFLPDPAC